MAVRIYQGLPIHEGKLKASLADLKALAMLAFNGHYHGKPLRMPGFINKNGFNISRIEVPLDNRPAEEQIDKFPWDMKVPLINGESRLAEVRLDYE